jgi:hypothetical protein
MGTIDFGPAEAAKSIMQVHHHSFFVDDKTAYGQTYFDATINGTRPDGSDVVNLTFAAGLGDASLGFIKDIANGKAYRVLDIQLRGDHTAGGALSPDLGPFLLITGQMWRDTELVYFEVDRASINEEDNEFMGFEAWTEFVFANPVRPLTFANQAVLAQFVGWNEGAVRELPPLGTAPSGGPPPLYITFRRMPGSVT